MSDFNPKDTLINLIWGPGQLPNLKPSAVTTELLRTAQAERVLPVVAHLIDDSAEMVPGKVRAAYRLILERQRTWADIVRALPPSLIAIKGPAISHQSLTGCPRYFSDIDVVAEDLEHAGELERELLRLGLEREPTSYVRFAPGGTQVEGVSIRFSVPREPVGLPSVELQVGSFPLTPTAGIPFGWFARNSESRDIGRIKVNTLSHAGTCCAVLASFAYNKPVRLRDLLDIQSAASALHVTSLNEIRAFVENFELFRPIRVLRAAFERHGLLQYAPASLLTLCADFEARRASQRGSGALRAALWLRSQALSDSVGRSRPRVARAARRTLSTKLCAAAFRRLGIVLPIRSGPERHADYELASRRGDFCIAGEFQLA